MPVVVFHTLVGGLWPIVMSVSHLSVHWIVEPTSQHGGLLSGVFVGLPLLCSFAQGRIPERVASW